jgi:hypothetical protein
MRGTWFPGEVILTFTLRGTWFSGGVILTFTLRSAFVGVAMACLVLVAPLTGFFVGIFPLTPDFRSG